MKQDDLCLVTGGAGFIGSHLVEALAAAGRRVRVLDDFSTGVAANLADIQPAPEIIRGDIGDFHAVEQAMQGVQDVFHLAALASVQKSLDDPLASHRVCATGTLHVLEAARRAGVRRVVCAASSSAYGSGAEVQRESDPLRALSPYAAAKLASEHYMQAYAAAFGLETVCLRFFNVFGPRQLAGSPYSGVIALFIAAMTAGKAPTVLGDGRQTRDFVYVGDVVQALRRAAEAPEIGGKVYNVGTGRGTSILELIDELNRILGSRLVPEHAPPRLGEVHHSRADISSIRAELDFQPAISLAEGLARTVQWYRSN